MKIIRRSLPPARTKSGLLPCSRLWLASLTAAYVALTLSFAANGPDLPPLTTASGNPRLPGKFVWADLVTDDVPAARRFYAQLFRWTFQDTGGYTIAFNDQRPLCGMFQRPRPKDRAAEPRWFGYISVANVGGARRAVEKAGGRVLAPPQKMPKRGEQALFADPDGALFGVIKSSNGDPEDFLADPGDWVWIQLLSRDAKKASEFYREVGDYKAIESTAPGRLSDYVLTSDGYARATIRTIPPGRDQIQPNWLPFVRVKNLAESLALGRQLGGKVLLEPKAELLQNRVAVLADPTGAAIGLMEWSPDMMKGAQ